MSAKPIETLDVWNHQDWRPCAWKGTTTRGQRYGSCSTSVTSVSYGDAVENTFCLGWIDSIVRRLGVAGYARKLTLRKADSKWSTSNGRRYADLKSRGLLAVAEMKRPPTGWSGDPPRRPTSVLTSYIEETPKANRRVWEYLENLAPSDRRTYVDWIDLTKREATGEKRLRGAVTLLQARKKLGSK